MPRSHVHHQSPNNRVSSCSSPPLHDILAKPCILCCYKTSYIFIAVVKPCTVPIMQSFTLYTILGVSQDATESESTSQQRFYMNVGAHSLRSPVRKAYRHRALATHPDKVDPNAPEALRQAAEGRFRQVRNTTNNTYACFVFTQLTCLPLRSALHSKHWEILLVDGSVQISLNHRLMLTRHLFAGL
jgi:hypothetical protein